MELTVATAAQAAGVSPRTVQRALRDGRLGMARVVGRQVTTDDLAVQAWIRTASPGRKWSERTLEAAVDLLSGGGGNGVSSSERSRLRSSLRPKTARDIASSAWVGTWARYRSLGEVHARPIGPNAVDLPTLGIEVATSWMRFVEVADLDEFERTQPVTADPDGDLVVVERVLDDRPARKLIDAYALGDARESRAAADALEEAARAL